MKIKLDFTTNSSSSSFVAFVVLKSELPERSDEYYEDMFRKVLEADMTFYEKHPEFKSSLERIERMRQMDKDERREYIDINYDSEFINPDLELGGIEKDSVGVTMNTILAKYSNWKISEIRKNVADILNKEFGSDFTEHDIAYIEEAWYDG